MNKILSVIVGCAVLGACSHTPNFCGTYSGVLPAADGPGIETTIAFDRDGTFQKRQFYLESNVSPYMEKGIYKIDGDIIEAYSPQEPTLYFAIEENAIRMLDFNRAVITGSIAEHYVLKQIGDCR